MAKDIQYKEAGKGVLTGEVTEAQVKKWKAEYLLGVYGAKADGKVAYFRNPDLNDMNCAMAKKDRNKFMDQWKEMADVTWLGGCEELVTNDRLFMSIVNIIQIASDGVESELVNL